MIKIMMPKRKAVVNMIQILKVVNHYSRLIAITQMLKKKSHRKMFSN